MNQTLDFNIIYKTYYRKMLSVCKQYTKDLDTAKDYLQQGFIKVYENLHKYQGKGSLEGWIMRVIRNSTLDNIKKNKTHYPYESFNFQNEVGPYINGGIKHYTDTINGIKSNSIRSNSQQYFEQNLYKNIKVEEIQNLIEKLPNGYKQVFKLFHEEELGHKEIGRLLGITENTSKSQYMKSRHYLQKLLIQKEIYNSFYANA